MKYFAVAIGLALMALQMAAQTPPANTQPAPAAPAWSPSKSIGVFAFPKNNQNADQQLKDESDCYGMAKQQTGMDPQAAPSADKTAEEKQAEQKAAAESAPQAKADGQAAPLAVLRESAAIGAIADDEAGKGAAAGAVAGTMRGGRQKKKANAASKQLAAKPPSNSIKRSLRPRLRSNRIGTASSVPSQLAWMLAAIRRSNNMQMRHRPDGNHLDRI